MALGRLRIVNNEDILGPKNLQEFRRLFWKHYVTYCHVNLLLRLVLNYFVPAVWGKKKYLREMIVALRLFTVA